MSCSWADFLLVPGAGGDRARLLCSLSLLSLLSLYRDPAHADHLLAEAHKLASLDPTRMVAILNNFIEVARIAGRLTDLDAMVRGAVELRTAWPESVMLPKVEAGIAALRGDWHGVLGIVESAGDVPPSIEISMWVFKAEALGALGRTDEALDALTMLSSDSLRIEEGWHHFQSMRILRAKLDIDRGESVAAVDRLVGPSRAADLTSDEFPLVSAAYQRHGRREARHETQQPG